MHGRLIYISDIGTFFLKNADDEGTICKDCVLRKKGMESWSLE